MKKKDVLNVLTKPIVIINRRNYSIHSSISSSIVYSSFLTTNVVGLISLSIIRIDDIEGVEALPIIIIDEVNACTMLQKEVSLFEIIIAEKELKRCVLFQYIV